MLTVGRQTAPVLRSLGLVVVLNVLFFCISFATSALPRNRIVGHVRAALAEGEVSDVDYPGFDSRRGWNQYNDCMILQMITYRESDIILRTVAPINYATMIPWGGQCIALRLVLNDNPSVSTLHQQRYARYWHGYNAVATAMLMLLDLNRARLILKLGLYAALGIVLVSGMRDRRLLPFAAAVALTGWTLWALPFFGQSFSHAPGDLVVMSAIAAMLLFRKHLNEAAVLALCSMYGAVIVYLDFMTGQIPTAGGLLIPAAYLVGGGLEDPRRGWRLAAVALAGFIAGIAITVVAKQALTFAIAGREGPVSFVAHFTRWTKPGFPEDNAMSSLVKSFGAFLGHTYILTYGSGGLAKLILAATGLAWLCAGLIAVNSRNWIRIHAFLACAAGSAIVAGWIIGSEHHVVVHAFMIRMLIVPICLAWAALAYQVVLAMRIRAEPRVQV